MNTVAEDLRLEAQNTLFYADSLFCLINSQSKSHLENYLIESCGLGFDLLPSTVPGEPGGFTLAAPSREILCITNTKKGAENKLDVFYQQSSQSHARRGVYVTPSYPFEAMKKVYGSQIETGIGPWVFLCDPRVPFTPGRYSILPLEFPRQLHASVTSLEGRYYYVTGKPLEPYLGRPQSALSLTRDAISMIESVTDLALYFAKIDMDRRLSSKLRMMDFHKR